MIRPVFRGKDFCLCTVRVPKDYPQSQTHAGIAYHAGKYYLTCSPYPVKKYSRIEVTLLSMIRKVSKGRLGKRVDAEKYENPLLYVGIKDKDNPPTCFEPLYPFPLMDTPSPKYSMPAYNSDPDIFIDEDKVYILNRAYYRRPSESGENKKEVLISLIRGVVSKNGYILSDVMEFKKSEDALISPCLIKFRNKYLFMFLETNSAIDGLTFDGLYVQQSDSVLGLIDQQDKQKIIVESENMLPWHMSLFTYNERLFAIVTCVERGNKSHLWQMMGAFDEDLSSLKIYPKPLTDYNSYRGAAIVVEGDFILYSTTLNQKVRGSKSVDGRDIIMAKIPICELLNIINRLD